MSWLPTNTVLGELTLEEVFVEYDGPRVFSCRSATGQRFIAGWAEEQEEFDLWLYLPISEARLAIVRSGGLTLRAAFEVPEGLVYEVTLPIDEEAGDTALPVAPAALRETWLPEEDFRLRLSTATLPLAEPGDLWRLRAIQERRSRMRLMVKWPGVTRSEAPTKKLGELLVSAQSLIDNVGLALLQADPPQSGRIPLSVTDQTSTDVVALSAASFVVDIASTNFDDLFDDSVFVQISLRILGLLDTSLEREELISQLIELRPRGAKSFRNFVRELASTGGDVTIAGAGASLEYTARDLPADRLETLSNILNILVPEDVFEIRGRMRLYRADMDRKQFGVLDAMTDERYEGQIAQRALVQVDHATVNENYEVVVSEFSTYDEAVGERKPVFVLEQLVAVDPNSPARPTGRTRVTENPLVSDENASDPERP